MQKYPNFSCHLDFESFGDNKFHSKGYVFEYDDEVEFVVGSTNITRFALLKNIEWNVSLCSKNEFESYNEKSIKGIIQQMGHYSLLTHLSESAFDNMVFAFN